MKTKNNFIFLTVLILVFLCQPVFAISGEIDVSATGKLTGKIIDKTTHLPLENVSVVIYSCKGPEMIAGTISNADGSFCLSMLKPGSYFLEINFQKNKIVQFPEFSFPKENSKIDMGELSVRQTSKKQKPVKIIKK
jgi:hypothetical protein